MYSPNRQDKRIKIKRKQKEQTLENLKDEIGHPTNYIKILSSVFLECSWCFLERNMVKYHWQFTNFQLCLLIGLGRDLIITSKHMSFSLITW